MVIENTHNYFSDDVVATVILHHPLREGIVNNALLIQEIPMLRVRERCFCQNSDHTSRCARSQRRRKHQRRIIDERVMATTTEVVRRQI